MWLPLHTRRYVRYSEAMDENQGSPKEERANAFKTLIGKVYFHRVPSYGNTTFYSLGFLAPTCLTVLVVTGITLAFMGQTWWLTNPWGIYVRSVHLWTVQAFIIVLLAHILVGFMTSGFRPPRRMVWVFGATIFCLVLIQTEFGYGLRGDFSSQYRAVSGADFWNGAHLGYWLNPLNYTQAFALHVAIIPFAIFALFIAHYLLEHTYGIARPYRKDVPYTMVAANHRILFLRGGVLVALILALAALFHSPYVAPVRIADVARKDPGLMMTTLLAEFDRTSDTATYFDSIDPYTFDTRQVYITAPYEQYILDNGNQDAWAAFENEPADLQQADLQQAEAYANATDTSAFASSTNPVIVMLNTLVPMAQGGLYESLLNQENPTANNTYVLRFLDDTGALHAKAASLDMSTAEWGMAKDETGSVFKLPPGSWWLLPLGMINSAFGLLSNPYGDRDAAVILGLIMLLFVAFPYIPYVNRLPKLLHLAPFIWGRTQGKRPRQAEPENERADTA